MAKVSDCISKYSEVTESLEIKGCQLLHLSYAQSTHIILILTHLKDHIWGVYQVKNLHSKGNEQQSEETIHKIEKKIYHKDLTSRTYN